VNPMRALILALALACIVCPAASAQPERRRPAAREGAPPEAATPDELRRFIRQRNATLERQQQILKESATMLDEGKSADEVRQFMREAFAEDFGARRDDLRDHLRDRLDRPGPRDGPRDGAGPRGPDDMDGPGGPPDGPDRARRADRPAPTNDEVLAVIKELNPRLYERLDRVRVADEAAFDQMVQRAGDRVRNFIDEKRDHPDRFERRVQTMRLEHEVAEQARRAVDASPADRAAAETELRATVSRLFDLRAESQAEDIGRLNARLDGARKRFESMIANRDRFIEQHTADLMQRAESHDDHADEPQPRRAR